MILRFALLFFAMIAPGFAVDAEALLAKGNQCFADGKFADAKIAYEQLLADGPRASVLTNLGNAHFRLDEPGFAALAYERALALEPGFADAQANLKFVREKSGARIVESLFWEAPALRLRTSLVFHIAEACIALSILAALWGSTRRERRSWLWAAVGVQFLIVSLGGTIWLAAKRQAEFAIVTSTTAEARTEPADRAGLAEALTPGSRVRVRGVHGAWTHCLLPGGAEGWVPTGAVERIVQ